MKQTLEKTYAEFIYGLESVDQELLEKYLKEFKLAIIKEIRNGFLATSTIGKNTIEVFDEITK